jgi:hypothetical protein
MIGGHLHALPIEGWALAMSQAQANGPQRRDGEFTNAFREQVDRDKDLLNLLLPSRT